MKKQKMVVLSLTEDQYELLCKVVGRTVGDPNWLASDTFDLLCTIEAQVKPKKKKK